jgi:hypothetical protein
MEDQVNVYGLSVFISLEKGPEVASARIRSLSFVISSVKALFPALHARIRTSVRGLYMSSRVIILCGSFESNHQVVSVA